MNEIFRDTGAAAVGTVGTGGNRGPFFFGGGNLVNVYITMEKHITILNVFCFNELSIAIFNRYVNLH